MPRSAKRRKARPVYSRVLGAGAAALGNWISENPVAVGGSTAFLVALTYVSANALWYQPYQHRTAFFATREWQRFPATQPAEPETTINIERPDPAAAPVVPAVKADPVVQQVQGVLKDLGFYTGAVDGLSGANTRAAVIAYQTKLRLEPTGAIDNALLDHLGIGPPSTSSVVPEPAPRPQPAPAAGSAQESGPPAQGADARIVKIQAGLRAFGNKDIKLDGIVGGQTRSAIKEFQALFRLPETGEPDKVVYDKMREIGLTD